METVNEFGKFELKKFKFGKFYIHKIIIKNSFLILTLTIHDIQFQEASMVQAQPENAIHVSFNRSSHRIEYKFQRRVPKDLENS